MYKVVKVKEDGVLTSMYEHYGLLEYEFGKWTLADEELAGLGYHPLVSPDLDDAKFFSNDNRPLAVVKCDVRFPVELPPSRAMVGFGTIKELYEDYSTWPTGTRMFGAVMPVSWATRITWGYKVIKRADDGSFVSRIEEDSLTYGLGITTMAKREQRRLGYHPTFFDNLTAVVSFISPMTPPSVVFRCFARDLVCLPPRACSGSVRDILKMQELSHIKEPWPVGTRMARQVILWRPLSYVETKEYEARVEAKWGLPCEPHRVLD